MQKAIEDYDRYLENGRRGPGGLFSEEYQKRIRGEIEQHERAIFTLQGEYNGRRPEGEGGRRRVAEAGGRGLTDWNRAAADL